ncbi:hypothetical protein HDU98_002738 [Podochytrium sp. JEL0797]|nr:hypothetical protein HDU98_002738 [Podochytrium sp. JEL0797]
MAAWFGFSTAAAESPTRETSSPPAVPPPRLRGLRRLTASPLKGTTSATAGGHNTANPAPHPSTAESSSTYNQDIDSTVSASAEWNMIAAYYSMTQEQQQQHLFDSEDTGSPPNMRKQQAEHARRVDDSGKYAEGSVYATEPFVGSGREVPRGGEGQFGLGRDDEEQAIEMEDVVDILDYEFLSQENGIEQGSVIDLSQRSQAASMEEMARVSAAISLDLESEEAGSEVDGEVGLLDKEYPSHLHQGKAIRMSTTTPTSAPSLRSSIESTASNLKSLLPGWMTEQDKEEREQHRLSEPKNAEQAPSTQPTLSLGLAPFLKSPTTTTPNDIPMQINTLRTSSFKPNPNPSDASPLASTTRKMAAYTPTQAPPAVAKVVQAFQTTKSWNQPTHVTRDIFYKTREDEVNMAIGDLLHVEQVYGDGWCVAVNLSQGKKRGMVPMQFLHDVQGGIGPSKRIVRVVDEEAGGENNGSVVWAASLAERRNSNASDASVVSTRRKANARVESLLS